LRSLTETAALLLAALLSAPAWAADFRSIAESGTILYDAPSAKAKRLFVVPRDYPVEVIVTLDNWVKVRDMSGDLTWVERKALSDKRTVVVTMTQADVRQAPNEHSALSFRVQQGVALDLTELGNAGWARVRHRDGQSGYIRINAIWGY
jgi:SH3-like domain-containing protein